MIYEYALEPDLVATWGERNNYRFFIRQFEFGQGRLVSRYPKSWARRVWDKFETGTEIERKRLEELLQQLKQRMVKRKNFRWDGGNDYWIENALLEHQRHHFYAILAQENPDNRRFIITDRKLDERNDLWDVPHGKTVNRKATDMAKAVAGTLSCCKWARFIDPHISPGSPQYKKSLSAFLKLLWQERPVGPPVSVEIHTKRHNGTREFLLDSYRKILPAGMRVTLYQWKEKPGGAKLHNRYILTDLGGISFYHGLDEGKDGETDDISRLDLKQYEKRCAQYNRDTSAFDQAEEPLELGGG